MEGEFEIRIVDEYKPKVHRSSDTNRKIKKNYHNETISDSENDSSDDESTTKFNTKCPKPKQYRSQPKTTEIKPKGLKPKSQNHDNGKKYTPKPQNTSDDVDDNSSKKKFNSKKSYYKRKGRGNGGDGVKPNGQAPERSKTRQ